MAGPLVFAVFALGAWAFGVVQARRRITMLEHKIRDLRAMSSAPIEYRPLGPDESVGDLEAITGELRAAGMTVLGDLVEEVGGTRVGAMRWFTDEDGTTFGWVSRLVTHDLVPIMLMSYRRDGYTITVRTPADVALAVPPFGTRQVLPMSTSFVDALATHRAAATGDLVTVRSLDDVKREMAAQRAMVQRWRDQQDPHALLEADLRAILGPHYAKLGKTMLRRLRAAPPTATVISA